MKIQLLIISLLFMTNGLCARGLDKAFQLLPQPQSVELLPGKRIMYTDLKFSMSHVTITLNVTLVQYVALNQNIRLTKAVMLAQIQQLLSTEQFVFLLRR